MGINDEVKNLADFYREFYGLDSSLELQEMFVPLVSIKKVKKNTVITQIGSRQSTVYVVSSGILRDYYIDADGNDITRFFLQKGNICGADRILVDEPSPICTETLTDCVLLEMSMNSLKKIIDENSEFQHLWQKSLEYTLIYKIKRENSLLTKSAAERYIEFRKQFPNIEKTVLQKYIASYIGITPVSLSRIRRTLAEF